MLDFIRSLRRKLGHRPEDRRSAPPNIPLRAVTGSAQVRGQQVPGSQITDICSPFRGRGHPLGHWISVSSFVRRSFLITEGQAFYRKMI